MYNKSRENPKYHYGGNINNYIVFYTDTAQFFVYLFIL